MCPTKQSSRNLDFGQTQMIEKLQKNPTNWRPLKMLACSGSSANKKNPIQDYGLNLILEDTKLWAKDMSTFVSNYQFNHYILWLFNSYLIAI